MDLDNHLVDLILGDQVNLFHVLCYGIKSAINDNPWVNKQEAPKPRLYSQPEISQQNSI